MGFWGLNGMGIGWRLGDEWFAIDWDGAGEAARGRFCWAKGRGSDDMSRGLPICV